MPAMKQAAFLGQKLSHARALGVSDAFDLIGSPCILIDRLGKVFRANKSAEPYFEDGLFLAGSELSCAYAADTTSLRRIVLSLCSETNLLRLGVPRSLVVRRTNRRPFMIQAVQLSGMICEVFSPARVLLFIIDPFADKASVPADELRRLFGLTKAETDLLLILERDVPLTAAAEQLHIKYETARTHLKSIMQKTQTKRQAELLSMVQRMTVRISTSPREAS
jgi:DNA-binding CsgD family transcriptional regulator